MVILLAAVVLVFFVLFNSGFFGGKDERIRISCVGDSLTYGSGVLKTRDTDAYPAQLQIKMGTDHLVSNFGLRNATASASGDLPYVESEEYQQSLKSKPDIVVLMLGTNDTKTYNWNASDYEAGLKELVESYQQLDTKPTVYLMRSPYCYSLDGSDVAEYDIQPVVVADELGGIVDKVAAETGVEVIDLYGVTEGQDELYTDGIHFNAKGYELIADEVYSNLK
ncbi:Lysophospholipase L1 [Pseudobutyrivibrio sp. JW11]|uniref:GDSL-type esterase/lipase family protein n=1 Tax=Pseudobutyrivibrio sp. JW11 TaxID=1855302 RepID=UPI0008E6B33C|nr:GDSL-type esterase/lipase family protein [Pseudobutyrivibrio sp. JW11]SFO10507.1 Lysophospholipase L1 [Pseudobutyrivibrio sp. JW11]